MQISLLISRNKLNLTIDVLFINNAIFLVTIDRVIKFRSMMPMSNKTQEELYKSLDVILCEYNKAGYDLENI